MENNIDQPSIFHNTCYNNIISNINSKYYVDPISHNSKPE